MFYTIYKITNKVNGKEYTGKHQTNNLDDGYMGSGKSIRRSINKQGAENFTKEILFIFDSEDEMNIKEAELVTEEYCAREDTYNMCPGGKGGWGYVNFLEIHKGDNNIMRKCPETKKRVIDGMKKTRLTNREFYANIARVNGRKASEKCKGVKCPSKGSSERSKKIWNGNENYEKMRNALSSTFVVIDPDGNTYTTNRLEDFCKDKELTYTSVWNTSRTERPVKKGKSKGWICKIIQL